VRIASLAKTKELLKLWQMTIVPTLNFGERGKVGEQTENDDSEDSRKRLTDTVF
jgi:hypothetical protein